MFYRFVIKFRVRKQSQYYTLRVSLNVLPPTDFRTLVKRITAVQLESITFQHAFRNLAWRTYGRFQCDGQTPAVQREHDYCVSGPRAQSWINGENPFSQRSRPPQRELCNARGGESVGRK